MPTKYDPSNLSPQGRVVFDHIKRAGSITQREAIMDHSVQSLTRRITELRDAGIEINVVFKYHPITGQRYAEYSFTFPQFA
jgi:hypothetical protein